MEDENKVEEVTETDTTSNWIQDNLRIIISVLIVVLIAGGIYSYSKRTEVPVADQTDQETITRQDETDENNAAVTSGDANKEQQVATTATSQETENSFVETAGKGDGMTILARRALANYLEKNPDSALMPEHKIYIEDLLRKSVPQKSIHIGTSVEFSKDLVQKAIEKSRTLNERQVQNLQKYAVRVPSLS